MANKTSPSASSQYREHGHAMSPYARKFKITPIQKSRTQWNKDWESVLSSLSARDVFLFMSNIISRSNSDFSSTSRTRTLQKLHGMLPGLRRGVAAQQRLAAHSVQRLLSAGHFSTIWILLNSSAQEGHLLEALDQACIEAPWHQDCRAMCPEVTTEALLGKRGQAFVDFLSQFLTQSEKEHQLTGDAERDVPFGFTSEWWEGAVVQPIVDKERMTFEFLTLLRNEFIARFIGSAIKSILQDIVERRPGVSPILDILKDKNLFTRAVTDTKLSMDNESTQRATAKTLPPSPTELPRSILCLPRCENCLQSIDDLRERAPLPEKTGNPFTMRVCGPCKVQLEKVVNYCSVECQRRDWPRHKIDCGKNTAKLNTFAATSHNIDLTSILNTSLVSVAAIKPAYPWSEAFRRQICHLEKNPEVDYFFFGEDERVYKIEITSLPFALTSEPYGGEEKPHGKSSGDSRKMIKDNGAMAWVQLTFRFLRQRAMSTPEMDGLGAIAEYLIEVASRVTSDGLNGHPGATDERQGKWEKSNMEGCSQDMILKQLEKEYGTDIKAKIREAGGGGEQTGLGEICFPEAATRESRCLTVLEVIAQGLRKLNPQMAV